MKKHNFYAGPSILSPYTIKNTADAVIDFANTGLSILEVSHRSKECQAVMDEAQALVKKWQDYITAHFYTCTKEILSCLGQMYVGDERFTQHIDGYGAGTAAFMSAAIEAYTR